MTQKRGIMSERLRWIILPGILAALFAAFPKALGLNNAIDLLCSAAPPAVAIVGMSFIQSGGWVDISCGCQIALVSSLLLRCLGAGWNPWAVLPLCLAAGVLCGVLNGLLIWKLGLAPTAAVITMMFFTYGLASVIGGSGGLNGRTGILPESAPVALSVMALCLVVGWVLFNHTFIGRYLLAAKVDENAVRMSGVNTGLIAFAGFAIGSLFFAISAFLYTGVGGMVSVSSCVEIDAVAILGAHLSGSSSSVSRVFDRNYSMWCILMAAVIIAAVIRVIDSYNISHDMSCVLMGVGLALALIFCRSNSRFHLHK